MIHPYASIIYADSLRHWGEPLFVPDWQAFIIKRHIPGGGYDAAGVYPITPIEKNTDIAAGLAFLKNSGLVSVVLVLDDFHRPDIGILKQHFDTVTSFKPHYIYRPEQGEIVYNSHHKRAVKTAYKHVTAGVIDLKKYVNTWAGLYDALIAKLNLSGLHAFPHEHHECLAAAHGIVAVGAWMDDELVSCHIWADDGEYVHSHLVAANDKGYVSRAGYAVNDTSLRYFSARKVINFGGGAGNSVASDDGLARFKRGFSNDAAQSYICGAVLDRPRYDSLVKERNFAQLPYFFPVYRAP